jgi:hypothetical protein
MQPFGILLDLDHTLLHTCTEGVGGDEEGTVRNAQQLANVALVELLKSIPKPIGKCIGGGLDIVLHPSHPRLRTFTPGTRVASDTDATSGLAYVVLRPNLFQFLCYIIESPDIAEIAVWSAGGCEYVMSLVEKILLPLMSRAFQAMHPDDDLIKTDKMVEKCTQRHCTGEGPHRYRVYGTRHKKGVIVVYTGGNCATNTKAGNPPKHLSSISHRRGLRWILLDDIPENVGLTMDDKALNLRPVPRTHGLFMWIPPFDASQPGWLGDRYLLSAIDALQHDAIKNPPNGVTDKKKRRGSIITTARKACRRTLK